MLTTKTIIEKLGGPAEVAVIAKVHRTRPYGWMKRGTIPLQHIPKLAAAAKAKGLPITVEDFMPGEAA